MTRKKTSGLKLVLPMGEMCEPILDVFADADLSVKRLGEFYGSVDDPRILEVLFIKPEQVLAAVAEGEADMGLIAFEVLAKKLEIPLYAQKVLTESLGEGIVLVAKRKTLKNEALRQAIADVKTLLRGAIEARGRVLLKLHVSVENLSEVVKVLPSLKSPTISPLFSEGESVASSYAVEAVVSRQEVNQLIPNLIKCGATDIIEIPITKLIR